MQTPPASAAKKTRLLLLAGLMAAFTAVGALIHIPLPVTPIPVTLQTLCTMLAGLVLGTRWGAVSQGIYLLIGLLGVPVFAGGGGLAYVTHPTFGFLLGLIPMAALMGLAKTRGATVLGTVLYGLLATAALYALGLLYLVFILHATGQPLPGAGTLLLSSCVVFLPGDALKLAAAALAGRRLSAL